MSWKSAGWCRPPFRSPRNIRIVHNFDRYIDAYGPPACTGIDQENSASPSSGAYTGSTGRPDIVFETRRQRDARRLERSLPFLTIGHSPLVSPDGPRQAGPGPKLRARNWYESPRRPALAAVTVDGPRRQERRRTAPPSRPCRVVLQSVPMDGIVRHRRGREGRSADALQRRAQSVDGTPPRDRHRCSIRLEGTTLTSLGRKGNAQSRSIALSERGSMFDPGPVRVHGERSPSAPEAGGRDRHHHVGHRETCTRWRRRRVSRCADVNRGHPRPRAAQPT